MNFLPLKSLRDEDLNLVGKELVNLGKLAQVKLPVASGIAVLPPLAHFKAAFLHKHLHNKDFFEEELVVIKSEVLKFPIPDDLKSYLLKEGLKPQDVWKQLLLTWYEQIVQGLKRGFSEEFYLQLKAQPLFVLPEKKQLGKAFYSPEARRVVIETHSGGLTEEQVDHLSDLVIKANQILFIPQVYDWVIVSGHLQLVKVTPFTELPQVNPRLEKVSGTNETPSPLLKSTLKVFLNLGDKLSLVENIDGIFIKAEDHLDGEKLIHTLTESALSLPSSLVIFRMSDKADRFGGIRGGLHLINSSELLSKEAKAFLFVRNKRSLHNVSLALPICRSSEELLNLKKELAAMGISRKATLRFWLEVGIPENILNIEKYLDGGIDGVVLNLEELSSWLGGFDPVHHESHVYAKQLESTLKFVEPFLKKLHSAHLPVLVIGQSLLSDEMLEFLVEKGVWGVIVDHSLASFMHEQIRFLENRVVRKRG